MTPEFGRVLLAFWTVAACAPLEAQRWQTQYLYDEVKSSLTIVDLQFPSAMRGVAVGVIAAGNSDKPVALVTADGGAHWQTVPLKEAPVSLFFLNENAGWMVGDKDLWRTTEAGRSWTKLTRMPAPAMRVYFANENTGWAACANKTVLETHDGGRRWTAVAAAAASPGAPASTRYSWIAFATSQAGLVVGSNNPPRLMEFPAWLDPDGALSQRETPHLSLTLETLDGGKTWRSASTSMFGQITKVRFGPPGLGLGLIEHAPSFKYASEVFRLLWPTGKNEVVFRDENFLVNDVWVTPDGACYLAGLALASRLNTIVPQKVKVLTSKDLKTWTPVDVDYRAMANHVMLAGAGGSGLWLATNNGMILKLTP